MAWDEWEQLKARAAERHSAQMELNQVPADPGGSGGGDGPQGDLCVNQKDLAAVGDAAYQFHQDFRRYSTHARTHARTAIEVTGTLIEKNLDAYTEGQHRDDSEQHHAEGNQVYEHGFKASMQPAYSVLERADQDSRWTTDTDQALSNALFSRESHTRTATPAEARSKKTSASFPPPKAEPCPSPSRSQRSRQRSPSSRSRSAAACQGRPRSRPRPRRLHRPGRLLRALRAGATRHHRCAAPC